jgi:hypothetical protein
MFLASAGANAKKQNMAATTDTHKSNPLLERKILANIIAPPFLEPKKLIDKWPSASEAFL